MVIDWRDWSRVSKGESLHFADKRVPLFLQVGFMLSCVAVLINMLASDKRPDGEGGGGGRREGKFEETLSENVLFLWQRNLAKSNGKAY